MTIRLKKWVGEQSIQRTFSSIATEVGITEGTVRNVFQDYISQLEENIRFDTPRWMGIDEIHIIKKPHCIISNIEHNTAVEVLLDRTKKTVLNYLQCLDGRDKVKYVAMDMWRPYKDAVQMMMPEARIVVDKFHVVRMVNEAMEKVRKEHRASLEPKLRRGLMHDRFVLLKRRHDLTDKEALTLSGWCAKYPQLGAAYDTKEAFYSIWDLDTRDEAESAYEIWKTGLLPEIRPAYGPLIKAVDNWHEHIFNYFDHQITNAYTESLNNLIRVMNRLGRGYSFEALRAKILFTQGAHKKSRPSFKRKAQKRSRHTDTTDFFTSVSFSDGLLSTESFEPQKNYGSEISTLIELFESELLD